MVNKIMKLYKVRPNYCPINQQDEAGMTALHYAVALNDFVMVQRLLQEDDFRTNSLNNAGQSPLALAMEKAAETRNTEMLELLIDSEKIDLCDPVSINGRQEYGLHYVVKQGWTDVVKKIVQLYKVRPDYCPIGQQDKARMTALDHAEIRGKFDIVRLLVDCGMTLVRDKREETALDYARDSKNISMQSKECGPTSRIEARDRPHNEVMRILYTLVNYDSVRGELIFEGQFPGLVSNRFMMNKLHIFAPSIYRNAIRGFHHDFNGTIRKNKVFTMEVTEPEESGVYDITWEHGNFRKVSTMFPEKWTIKEVERSLQEAFQDAVKNVRCGDYRIIYNGECFVCIGTCRKGIDIQFSIVGDRIVTAHPVSLAKRNCFKTVMLDSNGDSELHRAISSGDIVLVESLLQQPDDGLMLNMFLRNKAGETPLRIAKNKNNQAIIMKLMQYEDTWGQTVFQSAINRNDASTVQLLLELDDSGVSHSLLAFAMERAADTGTEIVSMLIASGKIPVGFYIRIGNNRAEYPLHYAVKQGWTSVVKTMMELHKEFPALCPLDQQDKKRMTALAYARKYNNTAIIAMLVDAGARDVTDTAGIAQTSSSVDFEPDQDGELPDQCIDELISLHESDLSDYGFYVSNWDDEEEAVEYESPDVASAAAAARM